MTVADILTQLATLKTSIDTLIASEPKTVDLQPVADAITAIQATVTAATPPAA